MIDELRLRVILYEYVVLQVCKHIKIYTGLFHENIIFK